MPLPAAFIDGEDAWRQIVDLTNPVHRVKEVHEAQELLASGHEAIGDHATFQEQSGALFTDLMTLVGHLEAIEHQVEPKSGILSFLGECRTANETAALIESFLPSGVGESWEARESNDNKIVSRYPILGSWAVDGNLAVHLNTTSVLNAEMILISAHLRAGIVILRR